MNRLRHIIKNTVISLMGQAITWASTLLLTIAYGHYLGATKFGELYLATTFVTLVGMPVDYGYNNQAIRDVAQKPDVAQKYFSNLLVIKLSSWVILYFLLLLLAWLLKYSSEVYLLIVICGVDLFCNALASTFASLHYAFEQAIYPTIGSILEKGLSTIAAILLLRAGADVQAVAVILVGGSLMNAAWQGFWFFRLTGRFKFVIDFPFIWEVVRSNIPFLITGILTVGYTSIDTVLLSLWDNSTVVGWYGAATRLSDATNFLPSIVISNIMYPVFSKLVAEANTSNTAKARMLLAVEKSVNFLLFASIPITTLLLVAAPNLINTLYSRGGFTPSILALQALAPYTIFLYINYVFVFILLSNKQDKVMPIIATVGIVCNLSLNCLLIPRYQQNGAAITTTITELVLCAVCIAFTPRQLRPLKSLEVACKALMAGGVMALVIVVLQTSSIFILLPVSLLAYLGAAFVFNVIPREDYLAIYHAIRQKGQRDMNQGVVSPEVPVMTYDLPTMALPVFYGNAFYGGKGGTSGTLLDIQLAVTGQLPVVRLPMVPQGAGLLRSGIENRLPDTPPPSFALPKTPSPTYQADYDDLFDIAQATTAELPVIKE